MNKFIIIVIFILFSAFKTNVGHPCHPNGDLGPCMHVLHTLGDLGPCEHTYFDSWGNLRSLHINDIYPCIHRAHTADIYPCNHICW